jgi:hypothetical protein
MTTLRVFPRKTSLTPTDSLAFIGDPPLFRPDADEVHISITFTWDIAEGYRLQKAWGQYYPVVRIGGPAFGNTRGDFIPGMYIRQGVTFTTRGCNNACRWCLVPQTEGKLIEIKDFAPGNIIQDNNLLQASKPHIERVFAMLRTQPKAAEFSGGIQASLVNDWFCEQLRTIRIRSLFLAADTSSALRPLEKALAKLDFLGRRRLRVYSMVGLNESLDQAAERLETIWRLGGLPFAQLYQPTGKYITYSPDWKLLTRKWSRPALMFASHAAIANPNITLL